MNSRSGQAALNGGALQLAPGQALHLGRLGGELTVPRGCVWLTRSGDLGDHFLGWGEQICLSAGENAVIEPAHKHDAVNFLWVPCRQGLVRAVLAGLLRLAAFLASRAAGGLSALARSAAACASRAQGYIELQGFETGDRARGP